jgi:hypothetical protein
MISCVWRLSSILNPRPDHDLHTSGSFRRYGRGIHPSIISFMVARDTQCYSIRAQKKREGTMEAAGSSGPPKTLSVGI